MSYPYGKKLQKGDWVNLTKADGVCLTGHWTWADLDRNDIWHKDGPGVCGPGATEDDICYFASDLRQFAKDLHDDPSYRGHAPYVYVIAQLVAEGSLNFDTD